MKDNGEIIIQLLDTACEKVSVETEKPKLADKMLRFQGNHNGGGIVGQSGGGQEGGNHDPRTGGGKRQDKVERYFGMVLSVMEVPPSRP